MQNRRQSGIIWEPAHNLLLHKEQDCGPAASWLLGIFLSHTAVFQRPDTWFTGPAFEQKALNSRRPTGCHRLKTKLSVSSSVPHPGDGDPGAQRVRSVTQQEGCRQPQTEAPGPQITPFSSSPVCRQPPTHPCVQMNLFERTIFLLTVEYKRHHWFWESELNDIKDGFLTDLTAQASVGRENT